MRVWFGVTDGLSVPFMSEDGAAALVEARRLVKTSGGLFYVVRMVSVKRVTGQAPPPPEPLVEDE